MPILRNTRHCSAHCRREADGTMTLITTKPLTEPMEINFSPTVWAELICELANVAGLAVEMTPVSREAWDMEQYTRETQTLVSFASLETPYRRREERG